MLPLPLPLPLASLVMMLARVSLVPTRDTWALEAGDAVNGNTDEVVDAVEFCRSSIAGG